VAASSYPDLLPLSSPGPALNADVLFMATQHALSVKKTSVSEETVLGQWDGVDEGLNRRTGVERVPGEILHPDGAGL